MKRILVPIDFSQQSLTSLKTAAKISKTINGEVVLLHMLEVPTGAIDLTSAGASVPSNIFFIKKTQEKIAELKKAPFLNGVAIKEEVKFESVYDGIMQSIDELDIDMVIMGSKGDSGIHEMIIGSNTEKIVRHATVPIMVIKHIDNFDNSDIDIKSIVFASDFSDENHKTFQKILDFAKAFNATLHLLKIITPANFERSNETEEAIKAFISKYPHFRHAIYVVTDVNIEKGILNFSREIKTDLIMLNTHGRTGLSRLFNGSIGEGVANHAIRPIVTFNLKDQ